MTDQQPNDKPQPLSLKKTEQRTLLIQWTDDFQQELKYRTLRDNCRCANCIDKRMEEINEKSEVDSNGKKKLVNTLPILTAAEAQPLDIVKMHPVGNYAYNVHFSDGHSAGIFTFELLRSLED